MHKYIGRESFAQISPLGVVGESNKFGIQETQQTIEFYIKKYVCIKNLLTCKRMAFAYFAILILCQTNLLYQSSFIDNVLSMRLVDILGAEKVTFSAWSKQFSFTLHCILKSNL